MNVKKLTIVAGANFFIVSIFIFHHIPRIYWTLDVEKDKLTLSQLWRLKKKALLAAKDVLRLGTSF